MKKKYYLLMFSNFILAIFFNTVGTLFTAPPEQRVTIIIISSIQIIIFFIVLNWIGIYIIYKPINQFLSKQSEFKYVEKRINSLPVISSLWITSLGTIYSILLTILSIYNAPIKVTTIGIIILASGIFSGFVMFLSFYTYFIINDFVINLKEEISRNFEITFLSEKAKIWRKLTFSYLIISIFPVSMLVSYIFIISYSTESSVYASSMALTVGVSSFVGVLIAIYFITRGFTKPIEFLFNSLKEVQTGNYMIETPVVSNDEIGILADNFNHMVKGLRERELIKDTFGKYVTKDVADVILKHGVKLKGEIRVATILVTDIKNYTSITEKMQPTDVVNMLNEYFSILVEIVVKHKGMVNKYMGDSLLAVYNIPIDDLEHTQNAINTALEIQKLTHEKTFGSNKITLNTRIGINTGIVIAGNIGSKDRLEYTVIGDAVNVASRLEQLNKDHNSNILVGENTYQIAKDDFAFDYVGIVNVRGKSEPINVYKVAPKFAEQLLKHKNIF